MKWFLLLSSVALGAASWDGCCPVECQPRSWFSGSWEGAVSALYWKPDNGGFQLGAVFTAGPPANTEFREIKPNYHWGVRGSGRFSREGGCSYLELTGLWIRGIDVGNIGPGLLVAPLGAQASELFGKSRHEYWNIDFRVGQILFEGCKFTWYAFGGVRYANFDFAQKIRMAGPALETRLDQDVRFYGVGPELGVHGTFPIWRCVDFIGAGTLVALVGERCTRIDQRQLTSPFGTRVRFPRATAIAPGFDLLLAARLRLGWGCVRVNGELGYEMNHVWNAYNLQNFFSPFSSSAFVRRTERDIGWAGPYLRIGIGF